MDPENLRTIVTGIVTVTVGVVPAWLLYRQNKQSSDRAALERQRERDAASEQHQIDAARAESTMQREELLRFLRVVTQIDFGIHAAVVDDQVFSLSEAERATLAEAYEALLVSQHDDHVFQKAQQVRDCLDAVMTARQGPFEIYERARSDLTDRMWALRASALGLI